MLSLTQSFVQRNNNFEVTPIMFNQEPHFLVSEIGTQLGYADLAVSIKTSNGLIEDTDYLVINGDNLRSLKDLLHTIGITNAVKISPNVNATTLLTESGFYALAFRSTKPECVKFRIWVTNDVLPSIRRTGKYALPPAQPTVEDIYTQMLSLARTVNATAHLNLDENQILLKADNATKKLCGQSPLLLMDAQLESPVQENFVTPTELGHHETINLSARAVNENLMAMGYQTKSRNAKDKVSWTATFNAVGWIKYFDTNKKHSDGTPVTQMKWSMKIVPEIVKYLVNDPRLKSKACGEIHKPS